MGVKDYLHCLPILKFPCVVGENFYSLNIIFLVLGDHLLVFGSSSGFCLFLKEPQLNVTKTTNNKNQTTTLLVVLDNKNQLPLLSDMRLESPKEKGIVKWTHPGTLFFSVITI